MDTTSNPSPTLRSPRSGGAAAAFESSELVSTGAVAGIGSPKHRSRGGTSSVSPAAVTQVIRIGDVESIVSSTGIVVAPTAGGSIVGGSIEVGTSSVAHDRSPRRSVAAAATAFWVDDGSAEAQQESSEHGSGGGNAVKKPAWNKLSNVANAEVVAASVMGAESWPALSESTRASPKSLSSESLKASSDGLLSVAQGTGTGTGTAVLSSPKQEKNSHAIPNSTPNHAPFNRQRSMKRGGGNSSNSVVANGGGSSQLPSRSSGMDAAPNNSGRQGSYANDSSSKDGLHQDSGQRGGFGSHSDGGNGHQPQRNSSFRRGNSGPHSRGEGFHHNGFGGRRSDQERGSHDWNSNRSFPVRDPHIQPQRGPLRPSIRGPPSPPFILPPQVAVHPYGGMPVMYPDMQPVMYFPGPHPDPYRPVALGPPMAPMIFAFPNPDLELHTNILSQIEYYFSNENLIKDMFLRQRMDDQGWVHINLIANFKKVKQLTDSIPLILDVLRTSSIVEVEGEKIRRRDDWNKWIMPQSIPQYSAGSSSTQSHEDTLSSNLQNTTLDDKAAPPRHGGGLAEKYLSSSSSGEWSSSYTMQPSQVPFPVQGGADTSAALDSR